MYHYLMNARVFFGFLIICCCISFHSGAQKYRMTTHIPSGIICVNEPFLVTFEIHARTDSFQKEQFPGFKILKGPAYKYGHNYKDRKIKHPELDEYTTDTTYSASLKYLLIPVRSGKLLLHGGLFYSKKREFRTPDTFLEVSNTMIKAIDSIKIINELWPESYIEKLLKEKVDSAKIDVSNIELTSDYKVKKVKLSDTFTITYKINYQLLTKMAVDFSDFEMIQSPKFIIDLNEVHAHNKDVNYDSVVVYYNWVCNFKPKKKGTFIIKPAVIYIKGQMIKSNEIKIIVK